MKTKSKQKPGKIAIGLTGGFASGKSTVRQILKEFGARTLDCDQVAHMAFKKSSPVYRHVVKTFGKNVLSTTGQIDRQKLGVIVFKSKRKKRQLEAIVHPYVISRMKEFLTRQKGIAVVEVPLLFEAKLQQFFDFTIVVTARQGDILRRARARHAGLSPEELLRRMKSQKPLRWKEKQADFVIRNRQPGELVQQVGKIWHQLVGGVKTKN